MHKYKRDPGNRSWELSKNYPVGWLCEALKVRNIKLGLRAFISVPLLEFGLKARVKCEDVDLNIDEIRTL